MRKLRFQYLILILLILASFATSPAQACQDVHVLRVLFLFYNTTLQSVSPGSTNKVIERLNYFKTFFKENTHNALTLTYQYIIVNRTILREEMASAVIEGQVRYWVEPRTVARDLAFKQSSYDVIIVYYGIRWPFVAHGGVSYGAKGFFGESGFISIPIAPDEEPISDRYADFLIEVAVHEFLHILDDMYEITGDSSFYNPDEMTKWTSYTKPYDYYRWILQTWPVEKWFILQFGYNAKECDGKIYVDVTLKSNNPLAKINIDGFLFSTPNSTWLSLGPHSLFVEPTSVHVQNLTRTEYFFSNWVLNSQSIAQNSITIIVDKPLAIVANFELRREHRVVVMTRYSRPIDAWIQENSTITLSEPSERVENDTKYVFAGWFSDGKIYSDEQTILLKVREPIRLESRWKKFFHVKIKSDSVPLKINDEWTSIFDEWLPSMTSIKFYAPELWDAGNGTRLVFKGWSDHVLTPTRQVNLSGPIEITALYETEYEVSASSPYGETSGSGWYKKNETVLISVKPTEVNLGAKHVFDHWEDEKGEIVSREPEVRIKVDRPVKLTAVWRTEVDYTLPLLVAGLIFIFLIYVILKKMTLKRKTEGEGIPLLLI
ncbi:hypothetical protein [Infirmifilum uzonense]|uniref:hypothetical protein n=1 Tax=Infirmifilum uzonense TaxID=1550241 RepID=UPI001CA5AA4C|nr:hypothetical protein [Infirmifilum uzonense]